MPLPAELPETIAIFPLPGALLLPRARLPVHIFEPRYLAMVDDVLKTQARLITKRLDDGKFAWPAVKDGVMTLSAAQVSALVEGLDWRRVHARRTPRPTAAG